MRRGSFTCPWSGLSPLFAVVIAIGLMIALKAPLMAAPPVADDFELSGIDEAVWWLGQIRPDRLWIDMIYRVRGGRNGRGLIEIWANGTFIARVRGSIGYDGAAGPDQDFKIGHSRDPASVRTILYLDNFKRGDRREVIDTGQTPPQAPQR